MTFLLDTNILSEFQKPKPDAEALARLRNIEENELYISVISIGEIKRGIALLAGGRRKTALDHWLRHDLVLRFEGRTLNVTTQIAETWAELMAFAKKSGVGVSVLDTYLAATALANNMTLITRNTRDFRAFDLELFDPWSVRI